MCSDTVNIHDLELHLCIGVTEAERAYPQKLLLTVEAAVDLRAAGQSKNLADTVSYSEIARKITEHGVSSSWVLLEEFLEQTAALLLEHFQLIESINLSIKKFIVPNTASTGISITRSR